MSFTKSIIDKYVEQGIIKDNTKIEWSDVAGTVLALIAILGIIFAIVFLGYLSI